MLFKSIPTIALAFFVLFHSTSSHAVKYVLEAKGEVDMAKYESEQDGCEAAEKLAMENGNKLCKSMGKDHVGHFNQSDCKEVKQNFATVEIDFQCRKSF